MKLWMRFVLVLALALLLAACDSEEPDQGEVQADLIISEFMASNESFDVDGSGEYPDWIEIHNTTDAVVDVGGYFLTDEPGEPLSEWHWIPTGSAQTLVPARGWLLLYADDTGQGPLHLGFRLSSLGDGLGLAKPNGTILESHTFGPQLEDISSGLALNGNSSLVYLALPTPGEANSVAAGNYPPTIENLVVAPDSPLAGQDVTISAEIQDDRGLLVVALYYRINDGPWAEILMTDQGLNLYSGLIAGQGAGDQVSFYLLVTDSDLVDVSEPATAPDLLHVYTHAAP